MTTEGVTAGIVGCFVILVALMLLLLLAGTAVYIWRLALA
jgi:hypothetical protein